MASREVEEMATGATIEELAKSLASQAVVVAKALEDERHASLAETDARNALCQERVKFETIKKALILKSEAL